jgi:hypothetical protein
LSIVWLDDLLPDGTIGWHEEALRYAKGQRQQHEVPELQNVHPAQGSDERHRQTATSV